MDEQVIRSIAATTGMSYDVLIGGDYKLFIEPFAFYKFEGVLILTTATEAAMYDEQVGGLLRKRMVSLSHKNLPLAMFLEVADLGYPAWSGSRSKAASNTDIKVNTANSLTFVSMDFMKLIGFRVLTSLLLVTLLCSFGNDHH